MLIRYLLIAALAVLAYLLYRRFIAMPMREHRQRRDEEHLAQLVQDPQCGVYVDSRDAVRRRVPGGELFFCSRRCAREYFRQQKRPSQE